jgi:hypothetical protein
VVSVGISIVATPSPLSFTTGTTVGEGWITVGTISQVEQIPETDLRAELDTVGLIELSGMINITSDALGVVLTLVTGVKLGPLGGAITEITKLLAVFDWLIDMVVVPLGEIEPEFDADACMNVELCDIVRDTLGLADRVMVTDEDIDFVGVIVMDVLELLVGVGLASSEGIGELEPKCEGMFVGVPLGVFEDVPLPVGVWVVVTESEVVRVPVGVWVCDDVGVAETGVWVLDADNPSEGGAETVEVGVTDGELVPVPVIEVVSVPVRVPVPEGVPVPVPEGVPVLVSEGVPVPVPEGVPVPVSEGVPVPVPEGVLVPVPEGVILGVCDTVLDAEGPFGSCQL